MANDSTRRIGRPRKGKRVLNHPYLEKHPDFVLSYHKPTKQFYKTKNGKRHTYGGDPVQAKLDFDRYWSYDSQGLPRPDVGGITVHKLIDLWLDDREGDIGAKSRGIQQSTWNQYKAVGDFIRGMFSAQMTVRQMTPLEFTKLHRALERRYGTSPSVFKRIVTIACMPWRWGFVNGKIDQVRMGSRFKPPGQEDIDQARADRGRQDYTASEVRAILDAANPTLRAAVLLGVNGGYTQKEVAELRASWLDRDAGVFDHPRGKTKAHRRVPLWPETLEAIEAMPKNKPNAKARGLLFVTREGKPYHQELPTRIDGIGQMFNRTTKKLGIKLEQSGFGKLRATHRTVSDEVLDDNAAKIVMGHKMKGVDPNYIRRIGEDRLRAIVDHVHDWLFDQPA